MRNLQRVSMGVLAALYLWIAAGCANTSALYNGDDVETVAGITGAVIEAGVRALIDGPKPIPCDVCGDSTGTEVRI
jgi:hypothetical protein